ncbi:MAG: DUF262 domain-containing protein [Candidatus Cryptobacteroides sp.]|nr:DUF262 domain-containing protein [Candidatus Cryptobacteroides sp.]
MISLTAEQKTIEGIFGSPNETYVIPMYQRPYSWGFDQLYELYRDLMSAYNEDEPYFLGNIIMARSKDYSNDGKSSVVDGQQRIITIWTLIKVLSLYLPDINSLQRALYVVPWSGKDQLPKIESKIFENNDDDAIDAIFKYDRKKIESRYKAVATSDGINERKCESKVEYALLYFYQQFVALKDDKFDLAGFAQFLMRRVTMLPIVQSADGQEDAENKALTIFETINNRGMDLEDADIFKARLYDSAYTKEQREEFIAMWVDFKADCDELKLSVDDIFRYYSHIIRGRQRITSNEKRLREFFSNEPFSPLKTLNYKEVLEDLNKILSILKYMNKERGDSNDVGIWLQIINAYTNQYPTYALVVYLYYNNVDTDEEKHRFISFLQSLIRYCFYMGSTTSVKFNIYNMIKVIANKGEIDANYADVAPDYFSHLGRLQNAFALLAYYLDSKEPIPTRFTVDKIVNLRDEDLLGEDWHYQYLSDICNSIGNLVVMDLPKRYNSLTDKYDYYKLSKNEYVKNILTSKTFTFENYKERNRHLKMLLANFFNKPEEND